MQRVDIERPLLARKYAERRMEYNRQMAAYQATQRETQMNRGWNRAALGFVGGQLLGGTGDFFWDPNGGWSGRNKFSVYMSALGQGVM